MPRVVVSVKLRGDGLGSDFEVPTDTGAAELARQFAQSLGVPKGKGQLELRAVSLGRALRPDETFQDAGLWDGATLILARASDPFDQVTSLALAEAHNQVAMLPVPPPPVLAIPPPERPPRSPLPFVVLGVVALAILALGAWFLFRPRESSPTALAPSVAPTVAEVSPTAVSEPTPQTIAPTTVLSAPQPQAQTTPDEETAWRTLLAQLDSVWGVDWPASISLLQAFHGQYPTRTSATDKLYSALVEYARALRDAGATGAATDELEQAVRLAPQRFEARDELAALQPKPTEVVLQPPTTQVAPQPTPIPLPTRGPAPTLASSPPPVEQAPDTAAPTCDVRSPDIACPLADGDRVEDSIAQPDGRHFYWFGVPTPGLQLHVEVVGQACPCTLLVFSDAVDNGNTDIAASFGTNTTMTVLDRLMPDIGPYLLEVVPDQNGAEPDAPYALAFSLQLPATPTPVPVVEEPTPAPTPTPAPIAVPPVVARPVNEAIDRVRAVGLAPRTQTADRYSAGGQGTVAAQDPPAGVLLPPGGAVTLTVASGNVLVPNVIGLSEQDAWSALHESGFEIDIRRARRSNVDAGRAADVNPGPGNALAAGSTVILTISQGP